MLWLWEREFSFSLSPSLPPSDDDGLQNVHCPADDVLPRFVHGGLRGSA